MKKIFNNKRVKIIARLCAITFFIFTTIFTNLSLGQHKASAADNNQGNETTALQKLYAEALTKCVSAALEDTIYRVDLVKSGKKSPFSSGYAQEALIEQHFKKGLTDWDDGKLDCNHNHGELASDTGLSSFGMGFTQKELFCNGKNAGIYVSSNGSKAKCDEIYEGNDTAHLVKVGTKTDSSAFGGRVKYVQHLVKTKTFGGNPPGGKLGFTDLEHYYIYKRTFFTFCADESTKQKDNVLHYQIKMWEDKKNDFTTYGYSELSSKIKPNEKVYVTDTEYMSCDDLANKLNSGPAFNAYSQAKKAAAANPDDPDNPGDPDDDPGITTTPSQKNCLTEAGPLGWIACTTGDSMGSFAQSTYENMIEGYLRAEPEFFSNEKGEPDKLDTTFDAWTVFRDIANIGFIVLLLVIIFSQLTGVGIDNYGIKKVLPKLVVTALLVNTSYAICQVAVDVSNIVGNSAKDLLEQIAGEIGGSLDWGPLILSLTGALGIGAGAAVAAWVSSGIWGLLLPLLLGLLGFIIAVLFLFLLLGARKALIIVFVVISPVAFLLYALPNTKKIFDKWFKVFKAMLLLYPICGFLMGGGALASSIVMKNVSNTPGSSGEFFISLSGMLIRIVPIFFIPSLVKGAFAAIGGVGAKLSGIGKNLSGRATGSVNKAVRNADFFKDSQEKRGIDNARHKASIYGAIANRHRRKLDGIDINSRKGQRAAKRADKWDVRAGRNNAKVLNYEEKQAKAAQFNSPEAIEAARANAEDEAYSSRVDDALAAMRRDGIEFTGRGGASGAYTLDNMKAELEALAQEDTSGYSRQQLDQYNLRVAALARGMAAEKGGASKMATIVRNGGRASFLNAMGRVYAKDSSVQAKFRAKDTGVSSYLEQFAQNGSYAGTGVQFSTFQASAGYNNLVGSDGRVKNLIAGVDQGSAARAEYLASMTAEQYHDLANNKAFYDLDADVMKAVRDAYAEKVRNGVTGFSGTFDSHRT